jgi:hypothetical protein
MVKNILDIGSPGSQMGPARRQPDAPGDQGVAGAHGRQGLVQAGPGAVRAGESLVEVDPVCGDAETGEDLALGGEVLQDG